MTKVNSILLWFVTGIILVTITTYINYTLSWIVAGIIFGVPMAILIFFAWYSLFNSYEYIGKGKRRTGVHFPRWRKITNDAFEIEYLIHIRRPDGVIVDYFTSKLCGLSTWKIHRNSLRIGFKYSNVCVALHSYSYKDGIRQNVFLGVINYNKFYVITIKKEGESALITVKSCKQGGTEYSAGFELVVRNLPEIRGTVFDCNIYYGGIPKAPCKLVISCQETNYREI